MSHHSSEPSPEMSEMMRKLMGEYPNGRMNKDDAGAIAVQIGEEADRVVMRFPKPVLWIGFSGDEAMEIAQALITHARKVGLTHPAVLRIGE